MRHPAIPADLLVDFGEPEQVFGPNRRTQIAFVVIGGLSVVFGCLVVVARWYKLPAGDWFSSWVAVAMVVGGVVVIYGAWRWPTSWVFVCPRGLVRKLGRAAWVSQPWSDAVRFEDATLGAKGVTIRQSRIVWNFGPEWGFIADSVGDYDRLVEVLREKVSKSTTRTDLDGQSSERI